ncbi:hypothetical protein Dimus_003427, partial [Dionaea muscipula]
MVGRRSLSQRRVVEVRCDSQSPDPRHPVMFRGSPSPPSSFHRRPVPSPGTRARRPRSPSPMLSSCADPDDVSSSEDGDPSEAAVTSASEEELSAEEGSRVNLCPVGDLSPIVEEVELRLGCDGDDGRFVSPPVSALGSILEEESSPAEDLALSTQFRSPCCLSTEVTPSPMAETLSVLILHGRDRVTPPRSTVAHMDDGSGVRLKLGGVLAQTDALASADLGGQCSLVCGSSSLPNAAVHPCPITVTVGAARVGGKADMQTTANVGYLVTEVGVPFDALSSGIVGLGDGGVVREEARVSPVARVAVRSQPTDGLRQPPSSPAVPVSG